MNVSELIAQLQKLDPMALVVARTYSDVTAQTLVLPVRFVEYVEIERHSNKADIYRIQAGAAEAAVLVGP